MALQALGPMLFGSLPGSHAADEVLTPEEYEEAKTYRDRTTAELQLVYQKRQLDRQREERIQALLGLACLALVLLVFVLLIIRHQRDEAKQQQKIAEKATKDLRIEEGKVAKETALKEQYLNALVLTNLADSSLVGSPEKSTLYAVEAMNFTQDFDVNSAARRHAEEVLRKTLANISGVGFHADLGSITQVAAHDWDKDNRVELRWLAAAGSNGSIALWDLTRDKPQAEILPFGYAHPIRRLDITPNGDYLVAENYRHVVTLWNLRNPRRPCYVIESLASDRPASASPEPPRLYMSSNGRWLEIDNWTSGGKLVFLGDAGAPPLELDLDFGEAGKHTPNTPFAFYSFSQDENWFARGNAAGEVLVWNLARMERSRKSEPPMVLARARDPKSGRAVNTEFMDGSQRLVVFFSDGVAQYWDLHDGRWDARPEVDLRALAKLGDSARLITNLRGSYAILVPQDHARGASSKSSAGPRAFCFDGADLHLQGESALQAAQWLPNFDVLRLIGLPDVDEQKRWLVARFMPEWPEVRPYLRIWDLRLGTERTLPRFVSEGIVDFKLVSAAQGVATRGSDNTVHWLSLETTSVLQQQLKGHDSPVQVVNYSQRGRWLVTGGQSGGIRAWNLYPVSPSAEPVVYYPPVIRGVVVTPDVRWLAISRSDGTVRPRPIAKGAVDVERLPVLGNPGDARSLIPSDDGSWLLEHHPGAEMALLRRLETRISEPAELRIPPKAVVDRVVTDANKSWVGVQVARGGVPSVLLWPVPQQGKFRPDSLEPISGTILCFRKSSRLLVLDGSKVDLCELSKTPLKVQAISDPNREVAFARSSPDGRRMLIVYKNPLETAARVLDAETGTETDLNNFTLTPDVFFSPRGDYLCGYYRAQGSANAARGSLSYWDLTRPQKGGFPAIPFDGTRHTGQALDATLMTHSADNRWLVTRQGEQAFLWDLATAGATESGCSFNAIGLGETTSAGFTSDSSYLVTNSASSLRVYDLATLAQGFPPQETEAAPWKEISNRDFPGEIRRAALTPHGELLAICGQDFGIRVWKLAAGPDPRATLLPPGLLQSVPTHILFDAKGSQLYSIFPNAFRSSYVGAVDLIKRAREVVGRELSPEERHATLLQEALPSVSGAPPAPDKKPRIPPVALRGKDPKTAPVASIKEIQVDALTRQETGSLSPDSVETGSGPGVTYRVRLPAGRTCQIDLTSESFEPMLRLVDDQTGATRGDAYFAGDGARIVLNTPADKPAVYRVLVIGRRGKFGDFALHFRLQPRLPDASGGRAP
jgi:WD40 repeat protein